MLKIIKIIARRFFHFFGIRVSLIPKQERHEDIIKGKVGNFKIFMNADHAIVKNIAQHPSYCANLPRLTQTVIAKYRNMSLVDVGANIGDSVALIRTQVYCPIICIEGDLEYFSLLKKNLKQFKDVLALNDYLGEKDSLIDAETNKRDGTLRIQGTEPVIGNTDTLAIKTLDSIVQTHQQKFAHAKVLKIDTDGYDLKIIRGSVDFLRQNKPVLFFEYDRAFLDTLNDDGLSIFETLGKIGYQSILFYDNYGRFLISLDIEQIKKVEQLDAYISKREGSFPYYDLCIFHKDDENIARNLISTEMIINKKSYK